jgi:hypothetical protein
MLLLRALESPRGAGAPPYFVHRNGKGLPFAVYNLLILKARKHEKSNSVAFFDSAEC